MPQRQAVFVPAAMSRRRLVALVHDLAASHEAAGQEAHHHTVAAQGVRPAVLVVAVHHMVVVRALALVAHTVVVAVIAVLDRAAVLVTEVVDAASISIFLVSSTKP